MRVQTLDITPQAPPGRADYLYANRHTQPDQSSWRAVVRILRSHISSHTRNVATDLVTTLFPGTCTLCDGPLNSLLPVPVCDSCLAAVEHVATGQQNLPACPCCGDSLPPDQLALEDIRFATQLATALICRTCRLAPPDFERVVSYATYDGELRGLIGALKYNRMPRIARLLAPYLAQTIARLQADAAPNLLAIAVPLFSSRERQRGYNQSILLADEALKLLRKSHPHWQLTPAHNTLVRRRATESSLHLSTRQRRQNIRGAFQIASNAKPLIAGKEILLIDDILTSGATARECARVLRKAGATKVWVATLARAQKFYARYRHEDPGEQVATWDLVPQPPDNSL